MTFPQTPLGLQTDLMIDGAWTEITSDVYTRNEIRISRGRANEGGQVDAGRCSLTLNNRLGKYAPKNPTGEYYGKIGRNTLIRVSVNTGTPFLDLTASTEQRASTVDHASLDITGDIDVRFEGRLDDWSPYVTTSLMGKWLESTDQRSWRLLLYRGCLQLAWSTSGTSGAVQSSTSTARLNAAPGAPLAVRATLDVNNGAAGRTVTFYTSDSLSGTWTQLGDPVVTSGTTSIFNSTASVDVGHLTLGDTPGCTGRVHAVEVRNGIGGSAVANPVFTAQAVGATTWADAAGRTWTVSDASLISNRRTRFVGEVTSWPTRWDTSGKDIWVPVEAAGILRRLGRRQAPIKSSMRRELASPARAGIVAYWPCEDGDSATFLASAIEQAPPLMITGTLRTGSYSGWAASAALPVHTADSRLTGSVPAPAPAGFTGFLSLRLFADFSQAITGTPLLMSMTTTGMRSYSIYVDSVGDLKLIVVDTGSAATLVDSGWLPFAIGQQSVIVALDLRTAGVGVDWDLTVFYLDGLSPTSGTTSSGTVALTAIGAATDVVIGDGLDGVAVGHVAVGNTADAFTSTGPATIANRGETAASRIARLGAEEDIPVAVSDAGSEQLGNQRAATIMELWREAEAADHGLLYESRNTLAAAYRDLTSLCNQTPTAALTYSTDLMPPLDPIDDDQMTLNDAIVQRTGGATGYASLESGALSVLPPPAGVNRYSESFTLNLHTDQQTTNHAGWLVNLGTVDEHRYPTIRVALQANPELIGTVAELDCGDRLQVLSPPVAKLPPGTIDQLVQGYTETLWQYEWDLRFHCAPASPYTVIILDDDDHLDTDGSVLGAAATNSATTLVVHTTQTADGLVPIWTETPADYPFRLRVGGEVVTATAGAPLAADTFTRTVAAGGWGTASDGHTYTLTNGTAAERSVAATYGIVTLASAPTTIRHQTVAETCQDVEIRAAVAVSATATGGSLVAALLCRWQSSSAYYRVRVEFTTGSTVSLTLTRGGTVTGSTVSTGVTYTPGAVIEVRVRVIGNRVLARAWATGAVEPVTWHLDETVVSSPITDGVVGLAASGLTGNTNVSPQIRFHDWVVLSPQRLTVTRSYNAISKAQVAGEDIRLANPPILGL
ncbi:hypothetical protein ACFWTC_03260 [Streptomyces sp. NPDC058619]|uniref:hypothetical protein n=1 Tax=unclassified Streptomyces TaxID=2593676 RepID=UPI00364CAA95